MKRSMAPLLVLLVVACSGGGDTLEFTVTFDDADGLQPGQFMVYNGIRVGEVEEVDLDPSGKVVVLVRAYDRYRGALYREAEFSIEKPGGFVDVSGERQLTVEDRGGVRTPIEPGEIIEGSDGWVDSALGKLGAVWNTAKSYATSPEVQELYESVKETAARAKEMGVEQYQEFMEETYPELKAKALAFKEWLEQEGRFDEAREFWNDFLEWSRGLLGEDEEEAPATSPPEL